MVASSVLSRRPLVRVAVAIGVLLTVGLASGCGRQADGAGAAGGRLRVVANFYPVRFLAERVGGERVSVTDLVPPGIEPHDLAVDGRARAALADADVVLYLGAGFQPDVEKAAGDLPATAVAVDLLTVPGVRLLSAPAVLGDETLSGGKDPHVWLDPVRMKALAAAVTAAYAKADAGHAGVYNRNLAHLRRDLDKLNADLRADLTGCAHDTIVTSHAAFGYLAARYGLRQIPIAGLSPDAEPDAKTLAEITDAARAAGVRTVFFEEALPPKLAKTVAQAIGARIDLLAALEFDPASALGADHDYLSVMRDNGRRLHTGLECR